MADDDEQGCRVEYIDLPEGSPEDITNWIRRAGKAKVTYPDGCTFEGYFDAEKMKQGKGKYTWKVPGNEDDDSPVDRAVYEGNYKDGKRHGLGKMIFPNKNIYEGEWLDNQIHGEGSYKYFISKDPIDKSNDIYDIYSGSWVNGKKHGQGTYEFAKDSSMLVGTWSDGEIQSGSWKLKGAAVYEGEFKMGRPFGEGKFSFVSGLAQTGTFVEEKKDGEDEEGADGEKLPPNVSWKGISIVTM